MKTAFVLPATTPLRISCQSQIVVSGIKVVESNTRHLSRKYFFEARKLVLIPNHMFIRVFLINENDLRIDGFLLQGILLQLQVV